MRGKSVSDWDPGKGKPESSERKNKLMNTEAHDAKDTMTGTNELKAFKGKKGTPSGPFGQKGKEF